MINAPPSRADRPAIVTAARILGAAIARVASDAKLAGGGVLLLPFPGFHYDVALERPLIPDDLREISRAFGDLAAEDLPVERLTVTGEEALSLLVRGGPDLRTSRLRDGSARTVSLVSLEGFIDLCDGAELPSTGACRSFHIYREVLEVASGETGAPPLQRLCGIVAEDPAELRRGVARLERAMERDHRWMGRSLGLFQPVGSAPGSFVWLPAGATVRDLLGSRVREHLTEAGFIEVLSSGERRAAHDAAYRAEPRGCVELPLRLFELSSSSPEKPPLRSSGIRAASPLTRDLESVFCLQQDLDDEIRDLATIAKEVHGIFALPLRAEVTSGGEEPCDLAGILEDAGISTVKQSEPLSAETEVVFRTTNVFGHFEHEAGRIRIDGSREREDLACIPNGAGASKAGIAPRPVTAIRASLFSSLEGLVAAILEKTFGFLPLWLSPVQARVVSVTTEVADYARGVHGALCASGLRCELDTRRNKVQTKLRDAVSRKIPFTVVVGEREKADRTVSLRPRERFEDPIVLRDDELRVKLLHELEAYPRAQRG